MSNKRKTLRSIKDFLMNIPAWFKHETEPIGKPEPLVPQKPHPDIEPPRPVEVDK